MTFRDVLFACAADLEFVRSLDSLRGTRVADIVRRHPIEVLVDDATGAADADLAAFVEAVCLSALGAWGAHHTGRGRCGMSSLVDPDVKVPPKGSMSTWEASRLAWPRVRQFWPPCTLGVLSDLAAGTLSHHTA